MAKLTIESGLGSVVSGEGRATGKTRDGRDIEDVAGLLTLHGGQDALDGRDLTEDIRAKLRFDIVWTASKGISIGSLLER